MFSVAQFFFLQRGKQNMYTLQERLWTKKTGTGNRRK
jgi:hypothetical protein